jgi:TolB protein
MSMKLRLAICAVAVAATLLAGGAATSADATAHTQNGLIAFSRYRTFVLDRPVRREIWVAKPDGSGLRQVTHVKPNYADFGAKWAPDGSRLVFTRCTRAPDEGRCTIWSVESAGTGQQMLSRACRAKAATVRCPDDEGAVYSPDARRIAFDRFTDTNTIMVSDTHLQHARAIFSFGHEKGAPDVKLPAWSPDGKRLAFEVCNCNGTSHKPVNGRAIYIVNVDGTGPRRLTQWSLHAGAPSWSPDGSRILFSSTTADNGAPGPAGGNLYTVRPDGTDLHQLTHLAPTDGVQLGSFSRDGTWIVFTTKARATASTLGGEPRLWTDVFTIKTDGTGLTNVTKSTNWEGTPDWGPRG